MRCTYIHCWDAVRAAKGTEIRLCCLPTAKQKAPLQRVAWGWRIYNIVESESDPLTRWAVDLFEKEPLKGNSEVHLHTPTKFGEDPWKDLGGDREHTHKHTNAARIIVWWYGFISSREISAFVHFAAAIATHCNLASSFHQVPIIAGWTVVVWYERFARHLYACMVGSLTQPLVSD